MQHLVGYYDSMPVGSFDVEQTPVNDGTISIQNGRIRIPSSFNMTHWQLTLASAGGVNNVQLETPSILAQGRYFNSDIQSSIPAPAILTSNPFMDSPKVLKVNENMAARIEGIMGAITDVYTLVGMTDGNIQPVQGDIQTIRATALVSGVNTAWTEAQITLDQELPSGVYDVVGMRAVSGGGVACRLFFKNNNVTRPGVPIVFTDATIAPFNTRFGRSGIWGSFETTNQPSIEVLGAGIINPVLYLDVIRAGDI